MTLRLHIDRLVLDGLPLEPGHGPLVQFAIEAELARLLAADALPPALRTGGAMSHLTAADLTLTNPADPAHVGRQIAQAVYGGLGK